MYEAAIREVAWKVTFLKDNQENIDLWAEGEVAGMIQMISFLFEKDYEKVVDDVHKATEKKEEEYYDV